MDAMSQHSKSTSGPQNTGGSPNEPMVRWVDLSAYKIFIGVHQVMDGPKRLVLIDETGENNWLAQAMQMSPSKIPGVWFRKTEGESFLLPTECKERFPKIRAFKIPVSLRDRILKERLARMKIAHDSSTRPATGPGWRPDRDITTPVDHSVKMTTAAQEINKITYCGMNHLGQVVMEDGNGSRFTKMDNKVAAWETEDSDADFLRYTNEQDLLLCAKGLVNEMQSTKMRSADFERYIKAIFGDEAVSDKDKIELFQGAVDRAVIDQISKEVAVSGVDSAYMTAVSLQRMRPSYYRKDGGHPTPPALSLLMQNIISAKVEKDQFFEPRICATSAGQDSHAWAINAEVNPDPLKMDTHDYCVGGVYSSPIDPVVVDGISIDRMDHLHIIESLKNRSAGGTSVFAVIADEAPGSKVDISTQSLIEWIGARYAITGLTNIDPSMIGEGVEKGTRLIVVGDKKDELDLAFVPPKKIPFVFGYEELWSWAATIADNGFQEVDRFGDIRQPNLLQVPYIPSSKASEPISMAPRNLMAPMRIAMARLAEKTGMTVDDYVCSKLGIPPEKLSDSEFLCSEQIDAIAMGISAIDEDRAFILADQAGLGKGRVMAALAAYSVSVGKKAMFVTEKPDLYGDFYRDARNIGVDHLLNKPFIFNTTGSVREMDGHTVIHKASDPDVVKAVCKSGEFPKEHDFALATFSMFNQEPADIFSVHTAEKAEKAQELLLSGVAFDDVPEIYSLLGINNSAYRQKLSNQDGTPAADVLVRLNDIASYSYPGTGDRLHAEEHVYSARHELEFRSMSPRKLVKEIEKKTKLPLNSWRGYWGSNPDALKGVVLLIDESHNAAGKNSNTGGIFRQMTRNADSVVFSSATFSKDEDNLPLYARVLPSHIEPEEIARIVTNGGEPMREIFTSMLAEDGAMVRREHDTSGISFKSVVDEARIAQNIRRKDMVAQIMFDMAKLAANINEYVTTNNKNAKEKGALTDTSRFSMSYSGPFSRFYALSRVLSASLNADFTADLAIEALRDNKKPVITTENTMESVLKELTDNSTIAGKDLSFKDVLNRYIDRMFTVYRVQRKGRHVISRKAVTDHLTPEVLDQINEIKKNIAKLPNDIPISPIDAVREKIEAAGYTFGEITGRKIRLSRDENGNQFVEPIADTKEGAAKRILNRFNSGELDVICLSNSGSTGISAHADKSFDDVRQRELIELQPASDIRKRIQIYGRVFRNGQVQPPVYVIPSTGMHHERRLTMIQNNSSRRMSSSVSGNADNNMINRDVPEIMNPIGDEICREWLASRQDIASLMNINVATSDDEESDETRVLASSDSNAQCGTAFVDKLTGRLFMLPSNEELAAWNEIYAEYEAKMEHFRAQGYNPLESSRKDIRAKVEESKVLSETPVTAAGAQSAFAKPVMATRVTYTVNLPAIPTETILAEMEKSQLLMKELGFTNGRDLSNKIIKLTDRYLQSIVDDSEFTSINVALASEKWNKVKSEKKKLNRLANVAKDMFEAGKVVTVVDSNLATKRYISLGVIPPAKEENYTRPSMWKARLLDIDNHQIIDRRMSGISECYQAFSQNAKDILQAVSVAGSKQEERVILEGNLFEASRISTKLRAGEAVSYSLANGIWKHGFMMPSDFTMQNVNDIHIEVVDAREAYEMLGSHEVMTSAGFSAGFSREMILTNSFRDSESIVKIRASEDGDGSIEIVSSRPAEKGMLYKRSAITRDSELKDLLEEGKFEGSKGVLKAKVAPHNGVRAIEVVSEICRRTGEQLLINSIFRKMVNERRDAVRKEAETRQETKSSLLSGLGIS